MLVISGDMFCTSNSNSSESLSMLPQLPKSLKFPSRNFKLGLPKTLRSLVFVLLQPLESVIVSVTEKFTDPLPNSL